MASMMVRSSSVSAPSISRRICFPRATAMSRTTRGSLFHTIPIGCMRVFMTPSCSSVVIRFSRCEVAFSAASSRKALNCRIWLRVSTSSPTRSISLSSSPTPPGCWRPPTGGTSWHPPGSPGMFGSVGPPSFRGSLLIRAATRRRSVRFSNRSVLPHRLLQSRPAPFESRPLFQISATRGSGEFPFAIAQLAQYGLGLVSDSLQRGIPKKPHVPLIV